MRFEPRTLRGRVAAAGKEFHEDESGAMMIIGLFFALFLVGALYYLLGVGQSILYRERMQDAADTAAFAGAVLKARAMNFIALINMIMALLLAILIAIYAIYLMLAAAGYIILPGICAASWICPPCAAACPLIGPTINAANMVKRFYDAAKRFIEPIIKAGSKAGEAISKGAPIVAAAASALRVETTYRPPAVVGFSLGNPPIERLPSRKAPYSELCRKAKQYANYPFDKLKDFIPIIGHIIGWIGGAFIEAAAAVVCEGSTTAPDLGSIGRSTEPRADRPAFILPRTVDQNNCLLNGDDAACRRFSTWQEQSRWDQTQGICSDVVSDPSTFTATLPAGATRDECRGRVEGASRSCFAQSGGAARWDFLYTLQEMSRRVEKTMGGGVTTGIPSVRGLSVSGPHERPLCGPTGSWSTSTNLDECLQPRSLVIEPGLPVGYPEPRTPADALRLAQQAANESATPIVYLIKWTQVRHILGCKEELPPRRGELVNPPSSGCDMRPQWVMPQSLQMGDEPFQQWGVVLGRDAESERYLPGVSAANRFNRGGGSDIGAIGTMAETLGRFSYAQAEFYYDGPDAGDSKEWLWNMGWTARLRRVRMPGSLRSGGGGVSEAASAAGRSGGGFSGFNLNSIADTLIIH